MRNTSVFSNFYNATIVFSTNTKFTVRRTNTYIHTYIHTYIQTPLAFNTLMWGSLRLAPIISGQTSPTQRMGVAVEEVEEEQKGVEERGEELAISFVSSA